MNLTQRLFLSFLVIALVLVAVWVVAQALVPKRGLELSATPGTRGPNLLSGTVIGLDPGDRVRLHLEFLAGGSVDTRGEVVHRFEMANGPWQRLGLALSPGRYRLVPEIKGYVPIPHSIIFQIPKEGLVWRYTSLDFEFLHPEDAPARLGLPLCSEPGPNVPVTAVPGAKLDSPLQLGSGPPSPLSDMCYANHLAVVSLVPAGLQGQVSGLSNGQMATITLYALPPVIDESYGQGEPPPPDSTQIYPPEVASLTGPPHIPPDWTQTATLFAGNGPWGLVDPLLVGGKYLVVACAPGQTALPPAYEVVISGGKAPGFPSGVDFAFGPKPQAMSSSVEPEYPAPQTADD
ncbi:MAG: hypothetical protein PVH11_01230 [Anaerolineae bacterium]|jgi:hypothetical protein